MTSTRSKIEKKDGIPPEVTACLSEMKTTISELVSEVATMKMSQTLLQAKLHRAERNNMHLKKEIAEMKAHSMEENLIFTLTDPTYKEAEGENCGELIRHFLKATLGIRQADSFYILVAHRLGAYKPAATRQIIARFPVARDRYTIMDNTGRLKGTKQFVAVQFPLELRERQKFALEEFKLKKGDKSQKAKMVREKLFIKGKLQTKYQPVKLPTVQ